MAMEGSDHDILSTTTSVGDYVIRPPTTSKDDGSPSDSLVMDCKRIFDFIDDERHMTAFSLYESVLRRLKTHPFNKGPDPPESAQRFNNRRRRKEDPLEKEYKEVTRFLASHRQQLEALENRNALFKRAKKAIEKNHDWILSQTLFGVTTYYRREKDGSLSIKMEGMLEGVPLFEQVAVLKEVDLHCKWAPFCSSSLTIKDLNKLDTVGWFCIGLPSFGLARDGCFRAMGCDNMIEDGTIIVVGQGLHDRPNTDPYDEPFLAEGVDGLEFPEPPSRLQTGRLTIRNFSAIINVLSADSAETTLITNINPNLSLIPQGLLDFIMRKLCGVLLNKLQLAARKATKDPINNAHARRMRQEHKFYKSWLLPKFEAFCEASGWDMPSVPAFELSQTELEREEEYLESQGHSVMSPNSSEGNRSGNTSRGMDDDELSHSTVSKLTMSSVASQFPLAKYLKELEQKTALQKRKKIEAARAKAAKRLKPKPLSDLQKERLRELKDAKRRRTRDGAALPVSPSNESRSLRFSMPETKEVVDIMSRFHTHTGKTRFLTTTILVSLMVCVFYPEVVSVPVVSYLGASKSGWLDTVALDVGTILYLSLCMLVHVVFCDVALVYAFDSLELGMKTGDHSKKYYRDAVRMAVACGSGALVFLSSVEAVAAMWLRVFVWYSMVGMFLGYQISIEIFRAASSLLPNVITAGISLIWNSCMYGFQFVVGNVTRILSLSYWFVWTILIKSNRLGTYFGHVIQRAISIFPYLRERGTDYVDFVVEVYEGTQSVVSWRDQAIRSSRFLLTYTAVFLLTILLLFNLSSRRNKAQTEAQIKTFDSPSEDGTNFDDINERYADDFVVDPAPIHERFDDMSISDSVETEARSNTSYTSKTSKKKKRFKNPFRRRKKGKEITPILESTEMIARY